MKCPKPYPAGSDSIKVPSVGLDGKEGGRALFEFLPYNDDSGLLKVIQNNERRLFKTGCT